MKKNFLIFVTYIIYFFSSFTLVHSYAMEDCLNLNNHQTSDKHMSMSENKTLTDIPCDSMGDNQHHSSISCFDSISDLYNSVSTITDNLTAKVSVVKYFSFVNPNIIQHKDKPLPQIPLLTVDIKYHSFSDMYGIIVNLN